MWAQRDDWFCRLHAHRVSTGILLLQPSLADYHGLLEYASSLDQLPHGDQQLISTYFFQKYGHSVNLLSDVEAAFGQCLGNAPTPYLNSDATPVRGSWSLPAFVHRSGGWQNANVEEYSNICFSINSARQRYSVNGTVLNVCHFHPLGAYWRTHLCDAAQLVGIHVPEVVAFCDDACWYNGRSAGVPVAGSSPNAAADACGSLNQTLGYPEYYTRIVGWPVPERPRPG